VPLVEARHQTTLLVNRYQERGACPPLKSANERRELRRRLDVADGTVGGLIGVEEEDPAEVPIPDVRHDLASLLHRQATEADEQHLADPVAQARL